MVPVIKSAMRVIVGLESDEQNGYAFKASFGELNESKKLDAFFSVPFGDGGNPSPLGEEKVIVVALCDFTSLEHIQRRT
jgi:hypothetical protein